jgi:hypothetical protein
MANIVESFIADIRSIESLTQSNRRFEIRKRITELGGIPKANGASREEIRSVLQDARDRAFQEISRHSPGNIPTETAELYGDVFEELRARIPTSIKELKDGTFEVRVDLPGHTLPHVARGDFHSEKEAQDWLDHDQGTAIIKSILGKPADPL